MRDVSDIKLKRTDTTHDLSQKAEKRYRYNVKMVPEIRIYVESVVSNVLSSFLKRSSQGQVHKYFHFLYTLNLICRPKVSEISTSIMFVMFTLTSVNRSVPLLYS